MRPRVTASLALGLSLALPAISHAQSVALLVETTAGGAALAVTLQAQLAVGGVRIVGAGETEAAARYYGLASPLDEDELLELRARLSVDRLVTLETSDESGGTVVMRFTGRRGTDQRRAILPGLREAALSETCRRLVRSAPPLPVAMTGSHPGDEQHRRVQFAQGQTAPPPVPFGRSLTFEIGLGAGFADGRDRTEIEHDGVTDYAKTFSVSPFLGVFPVRGLELSVEAGIDTLRAHSSENTYDHASGYTAMAGLALLPAAGDRVRIGPRVAGGVTQGWGRGRFVAEVDDGDLELARDELGYVGERLTAGIAARIPVGSSAVLTVEAHYFVEVFEVDYRIEGESYSGNARGSGGELSFGIAFWKRRHR